MLGTTYGEGDGSTTFNLPNYKGRIGVGKDENDTDFNELGKTGGSKHLQDHVHILEGSAGNIYYQEGGSSAWINKSADISSEYRAYAGTIQDRQGNNMTLGNSGNLQPYTVTNYIIKAHQSAGVVAEVIQKDGEASTTNVYSADAIDNKFSSIIETIENENGEATKFSDGTMICQLSTIANIAINKSYGNLYQDDSYIWTFPVPFMSDPVVTVGMFIWGETSASWGTCYSNNTTMAKLRVYDVVERGAGDTYIKATAIGRWK